MRYFFTMLITIPIALLSCNRPECTNTNPVFDQYTPSSPEYKAELAAQLRNANPNDLRYWLDKYVEDSGNEYLQFHIQGADLCASGLMKVETWNDKIANIKKVKGMSYGGAEFRGLRFTIEGEGENTELVYKDFDRLID